MLDISVAKENPRPARGLNRYRPLLLLVLVLSLTAVPAATAGDESRWIDLTHDLSSDAVFWPTAKPFEMTADFKGKTEKGYWCVAKPWTGLSHNNCELSPGGSDNGDKH